MIKYIWLRSLVTCEGSNFCTRSRTFTFCSKLNFGFSQANLKFSFSYLADLFIFPYFLDWLLRTLTFRCAVKYCLDLLCFDFSCSSGDAYKLNQKCGAYIWYKLSSKHLNEIAALFQSVRFGSGV